MKKIAYTQLEGRSFGFYSLIAILGVIILAGLGATYYMEHHGHYVTGMTNQVVWGMPHVFAILLILAASGVLNVASVGTVFGKSLYKPLGRLSGLMAITLLIGGLCVLVLDLGHPDRLIVAMTSYNFKSIFAWNIFLYTGFMVIVGIYLWWMMERSMQRYYPKAGLVAFIWRLILTTGTGSIFGFLVAREAYDAAILAPLFIAMSLSLGLAFFLIVLIATYHWAEKQLGNAVLFRLKNLLGVFVAVVLYFVAAYHLTNLYITENHDVERFILIDGGVYTLLFWLGQIALGSILPLILLYSPAGNTRPGIVTASLLVLLGGIAQLYVIIIGGQAYPLEIFPGMEVVSSGFFDLSLTEYHRYVPTLWEIMLGVGGVAFSLLATIFALRVLQFLPVSLADADIDPHAKKA